MKSIPNKQNTIKRYFLWFLLCTIVFVISTFVHECGHGFSFAMIGQPVSTGFNRIGNIFMFPKDKGFRTNLNLNANSLSDFGVPITLLLAIAFTIIYCKYKFKKNFSETVVLSIALCNSIIRLVPALFICLVPIFTGKSHMEDELETGLALQKMLEINCIKYLPALVSIGISILCLCFITKRVKNKGTHNYIMCISIFVVAYIVAFIIENLLDNIIRINWRF